MTTQPETKIEVLPSEAIFSFIGWLTSMKTPVTFGASVEAGIAAELAGFFCDHQGWEEPRCDRKIWPANVRTYPTNEEWEIEQAKRNPVNREG
jgi:hypothetical protein